MPAVAAGCFCLRVLAVLLCCALASAWTVPFQQPAAKAAPLRKQQLTMSTPTKSVLFICLGNICRCVSRCMGVELCSRPICSIDLMLISDSDARAHTHRSPSAEAVFKAVVEKNGQGECE